MAVVTAAVVAGGATILASRNASKASKSAANTQAAASDRAIAGLNAASRAAVSILEKSTGESIETIRGGSLAAQNQLNAGRANSESLLTTAVDAASGIRQQGASDTINVLESSRRNIKSDIMNFYNLSSDQITSSARKGNRLINEAVVKAATSINDGFGAAATDIRTGRDLAVSILKGTATDAREALDIARINAISAQDEGLANIRGDFQAYIDAGNATLPSLERLTNDPEAQRQFITNNPFFESLANESERRIFGNQAARGKVGSGETAAGLQTQLLLLGNDLLDGAINRKASLAAMGLDAAQFVGQAESARANNVSNIEAKMGMSLAELAATMGTNEANVINQASTALANLNVGRGESIANIESQAGQNRADIALNEGSNLANLSQSTSSDLASLNSNIDTNIANTTANLSNSLANDQLSLGDSLAGLEGSFRASMANLETGTASAIANLNEGQAINKANVLTGNAANVADTEIGKADALAAGQVGSANAYSGGIQDLVGIGFEYNRANQLDKMINSPVGISNPNTPRFSPENGAILAPTPRLSGQVNF
jgi:hypothetical protein